MGDLYRITKVVKENCLATEIESMEESLFASREILKQRTKELMIAKSNNSQVRQNLIEAIQSECSYVSHLVASLGEVYDLINETKGETKND